MTPEITVEEAERLRRIRASQVQVVVPNTAKSASDAMFDLTKLKPHPDTERRKAERDAADRQEAVSRLRHHWNAPKRQLDRETLDATGEWGATLKKVEQQIGTGFLIALIGTRGSGKTQIGVEAMKRVTANLKSARYETAMGFFMAIKASYKKEAKETEEDVVERFSRPALLVLDELGKRGETDWEDRLLCELVDNRYRDVKDTLLISNQERVPFLESIGPSIASRMLECGGIVDCTWESFR